MENNRISISKKPVSNVKRKRDFQRNSVDKIEYSRSRPVATQSLVFKVIKQIDIENPYIQRSIPNSYRVSQSTISRISKRFNAVPRKKQKIYKLTPEDVADVHVDFIHN